MDVLSRTAPAKQTTELRGECPVEIVAVIDAVAVARDQTRTEIVNEVLRRWARQQLHEATLVGRVLRGQSGAAEALGVPTE